MAGELSDYDRMRRAGRLSLVWGSLLATVLVVWFISYQTGSLLFYWGDHSSPYIVDWSTGVYGGSLEIAHNFGPFWWGSCGNPQPAMEIVFSEADFVFATWTLPGAISGWGLRIPVWLPAGLLSYPTVLWVVRFLYFRSTAEGLCPVCGFDLRATPKRCPECGRVVVDASAPTAPNE